MTFKLTKKKSASEKILGYLPQRKSKTTHLTTAIMRLGLYISIFFAGYLIAQIQMLLGA